MRRRTDVVGSFPSRVHLRLIGAVPAEDYDHGLLAAPWAWGPSEPSGQ